MEYSVSAVAQGEIESVANGDIRILIVEDSASLLHLYRHVLTRAGYTVLEASTAAAALEIVQRQSPDILLLDRVLPDMDGSEICARIKTDPATAEIYVIMLSGLKTSEDDRVSGLEAGADDYVLKPVGKRELLARIHVAVRLRHANQKLRTSEMQYRSLTENSPDYIARIGGDGRIRYLNPAARDLLRREATGDSHVSRFVRHLTNNGALSAHVRAVFEHGQSSRAKSTLRHGAEFRHLDTRLVPEFGPGGEVVSVLAVARDYTDFVIAEQEIRRLATVIQQSVDAVQITDSEGHIIYANAAYAELTGVAVADAVGRVLPGYAYTCPEHDTCDLLDHLTEEIERWQGLIALHRADGQERELDTTLFPIRNLDGEIINYAALQRDVTERRRAEEEREVIIGVAAALRSTILRQEVLEVTLERIMALLHVVGAAYGRIDHATGDIVVECAHGAHTAYTGRRFSLDDSRLNSIIAGKAALTVPSLVQPVSTSASVQDPLFPAHVQSAAGAPLWIEDGVEGVLWIGASTPISGPMIRLLGSLADMVASSLQRAELYEAARRYAEELEQRVIERTQELAEANEQLRELDRLKSKFVSNVSHELRTPIANFKLYLNLLERGKESKRSHYEAMLRQSADRLGQLVQDILSLSRLEMAQLQPRELEPTNFNSVVAQVVQHHQPQAEAAGLQLDFSSAPDLPLVPGDFNQLSQLVTNLISNALTYTQTGSVRVETSNEKPDANATSPPYVHLIVTDTGTGIEPNDMPHIFERFYRGNHQDADDIPGTGLGLAIVKEIVDIHQGRIKIDSAPGQGTRIDVTLPACTTDL